MPTQEWLKAAFAAESVAFRERRSYELLAGFGDGILFGHDRLSLLRCRRRQMMQHLEPVWQQILLGGGFPSLSRGRVLLGEVLP